MKVLDIFLASDEYVRVAVSSEADDVRQGTIQFGLSSDKDVPPTAWALGEWASTQKVVAEIDGEFVEAYIARVLSADLGLAAGVVFVFTKVVLGDQQIIKLAGKMKVT